MFLTTGAAEMAESKWVWEVKAGQRSDHGGWEPPVARHHLLAFDVTSDGRRHQIHL